MQGDEAMKGHDFAAGVKAQVSAARATMTEAKARHDGAEFNPFCGLAIDNLLSIHETTAEYFGNGFTLDVQGIVYQAAKEAVAEGMAGIAKQLAADREKATTPLPWNAYAQKCGLEIVRRVPWLVGAGGFVILILWGPDIIYRVAQVFQTGG